MLNILENIKTGDSFFVLFNKSNFHSYTIQDALFFRGEEFLIIKAFLRDFYDFDIRTALESNEYMISLPPGIVQLCHLDYCGIYPAANCIYSNLENERKCVTRKNEILNEIIKKQEKRFLPDNTNNKVICFHDGNGEFDDLTPLNPLVFDFSDIDLLRQFCRSMFHFSLETCFHGKNETCCSFLNDDMKSFFRRRIISSNYKDEIRFSDAETEKKCMLEKQNLNAVLEAWSKKECTNY